MSVPLRELISHCLGKIVKIVVLSLHWFKIYHKYVLCDGSKCLLVLTMFGLIKATQKIDKQKKAKYSLSFCRLQIYSRFTSYNPPQSLIQYLSGKFISSSPSSQFNVVHRLNSPLLFANIVVEKGGSQFQ